jgi:hypothetical protein
MGHRSQHDDVPARVRWSRARRMGRPPRLRRRRATWRGHDGAAGPVHGTGPARTRRRDPSWSSATLEATDAPRPSPPSPARRRRVRARCRPRDRRGHDPRHGRAGGWRAASCDDRRCRRRIARASSAGPCRAGPRRGLARRDLRGAHHGTTRPPPRHTTGVGSGAAARGRVPAHVVAHRDCAPSRRSAPRPARSTARIGLSTNADARAVVDGCVRRGDRRSVEGACR